MAQIARHHREAVLEGGGGDQQIGSVMAEFSRELTPAASGGQIHRQQALPMEPQQLIEPGGPLLRTGSIG